MFEFVEILVCLMIGASKKKSDAYVIASVPCMFFMKYEEKPWDNFFLFHDGFDWQSGLVVCTVQQDVLVRKHVQQIEFDTDKYVVIDLVK